MWPHNEPDTEPESVKVRDRHDRFLHYNDELHEMTERIFEAKPSKRFPIF